MNAFKTLILCLLLFVQAISAQEVDEYTGNAGQRVEAFEHASLN